MRPMPKARRAKCIGQASNSDKCIEYVLFHKKKKYQEHLMQSGHSTQSAVDIFSIHSMYLLKSQSENKELSWGVWMEYNM